MNKLNCIIANIIFAIVIVLGYFFITNESDAQLFQQIAYLYITILAFFQLKHVYGSVVNIHSIFIFFVLFFGGSRFILGMFNYEDIMDTCWFTGNRHPFEATIRSMLNVNLAVCFYTTGALLVSKKNNLTHKYIDKPIEISNSILYALLVIGLIIKVRISIILFSEVILKAQYLDMHSGELILDYNIYDKIITELPMFALFALLTKKRNYLWIIIFVLYAFLDMATGQRGFTILTFTIMYYYLLRMGYVKFNIIKISLIILAFLIIFIFVGWLRAGVEQEEVDLLAFIWRQGTSFEVLQLTVALKDQLDYTLFNVADNVLSFFKRFSFVDYSEYNSKILNVSIFKGWSSYISYMANSSMYSRGYGVGGNYIGQLFAIGGEFAVIVGNLLIARILTFFDNRLDSKNILIAFTSFICLRSLIYIPRDNIFDFITDAIPYLFIPCILFFLLRYSRNKYNQNYIK